MRRRGGAFLRGLLLGMALPASAQAQESDDLRWIPAEIQQDTPSAPSDPTAPVAGRFYLENATTITSDRSSLAVPYPSPQPSVWQNRSTADASYRWAMTPELTAVASDRLNLSEQPHQPISAYDTVRNDLRELYLTWEPAPETYLELGRINHRQGVALGFNPTDYFRAGTQVDLSSVDPSDLREDRLGTLMLRGQMLFDGWSAVVVIAPKTTSQTPIRQDLSISLNPLFGQTNGQQREMASVGTTWWDLTAQASFYHEGDKADAGLELSYPIGKSIIAYAEWSGAREKDLVARAIDFGKQTGSIPAYAPMPLPTDNTTALRNALALGASWASAHKLTLNLEYHYNQSGLSARDWENWFLAGRSPAVTPLSRELWFIREYATYQQEPIGRNQAFLRLDWADAFVNKLDINLLSFASIDTKSSLLQLSFKYYLNDNLLASMYSTADIGRKKTEYGNFPEYNSYIAQIDWYF